jgi:BirA family biotin operon repressor/biotin-[acetyl-CoA-carboxylase] ligase
MSPTADPVLWELPHTHIGRRVYHFAQLPSTSDFAASLAADPENAGVVILADEQTSGRGQYGRRWVSPPGSSVLMSMLLFPPTELRRPAILTAWAANSVCETIFQITGQQGNIKWPNDVLLQGRKVSGVLIEQGRAVVAGIGLNVNQIAAEFDTAGLAQAGSLAAAMGRSLDTIEVARLLIKHLDCEFGRLVAGELSTLEAAWQSRLGLAGNDVVIEDMEGRRHRGRLLEASFAGLELQREDGIKLHFLTERVRSAQLEGVDLCG